jgi:tight adherence protein B
MASLGQSVTALATLALILAMMASLMAYVIARHTGPRARLKARMAVIAGPRQGPIAKGAGATTTRRTRQIKSKLKEAADTGAKPSRRVEMRLLIDRSGLALEVRSFYVWSAVAAVVGTGLYLLLGYPWYWFWAVLVVMGVGLPRKVLGMIAARRQKNFTRHFADAIDVIVRGIRSGLPVGECLNIIARESPEPVATEFRLLIEGQRLGMTLKQTLERSCRRMPTADMKFFAIVLNLQQQTGGNLAETLAGLSDVLRQRKKMTDKVKSMSSEARTTAMIIGSMPFLISLMIYVISPDYISLLWTDHTGKKIFYGGLIWMTMGVLIMRKMIAFPM